MFLATQCRQTFDKITSVSLQSPLANYWSQDTDTPSAQNRLWQIREKENTHVPIMIKKHTIASREEQLRRRNRGKWGGKRG